MSEQHYKRAKEFLENKDYEFEGEVVGLPISFKYKIHLLDRKPMIHVGEKLLTQFISIDIIELGENGVFLKNMKTFGNTQLPYEIRLRITRNIFDLIVRFLKIAESVIVDPNYKILDSLNESTIFESKSMRSETAKISSDILKTLKKQTEDNKEYRLPEDITGDHAYEFISGSDIAVNLNIIKQSDLEKPFMLNAEYIDEESDINVLIIFDPKELPNLLNELHYELNEVIRHELEHYKQDISGDLPKKKSKSKLKYYLQPHELDAQIAGFKRISKLKKIPFDVVARQWFLKNQHVHGLSQNEVGKIFKELINRYESI